MTGRFRGPTHMHAGLSTRHGELVVLEVVVEGKLQV
jgi:hypothetical protein